MDGAAAPQGFRRTFREGDEARLALFHQRRHRRDAVLDRHVRIDARQAEDVKRRDAEILEARLAGLAQIARIAAAAAAVARAAAFRMNHHLIPAALDRFSDQAVVMAIAIARGGIEEIDAELERAANRGDRFAIVSGAVGTRYAVEAEPDHRDHE